MKGSDSTGIYRIDGDRVIGPNEDFVVILGQHYIRKHSNEALSPVPGWTDRPGVEILVDELNILLSRVRKLEELVS